MNFNNIWTKELNDKLRQMIKEGRSVDDIKTHFGSLLEHHPKKKYSYGKILPFKNFLTEIKVNPKYTRYELRYTPSIFISNKNDIVVYFETNNQEYVLILFYYIDSGIESYNILFTTQEYYDEYNNKLDEIKKTSTELTDDDNIELSSILEKETDLKEPYLIMNKISYIIFDIYSMLNNMLFSIGDTRNPVKINMYRSIIRDSFDNVDETESVDNLLL